MGTSPGDVHQPLLENENMSENPIDWSNELERTLSDSEKPLLQRLRLATWIELKILFYLAAPAIAVYTINFFMSTTTQIFSGHIGNLELAAASLGGTGVQIFVHGLMLGMASAAETLCGQAYGAQKFEMLGIYLQRSTILLILTGVPLTLIYTFSNHILRFLGQSSEIASAAATFVYGLIPQIFGFAVNFPLQKFMQAQSIVAPSAYISLAALALHILLSWFVVYKIGLGLLGASLVLSLSWWIIGIGQYVYIVNSEKCKQAWTGFRLEAFSDLFSFFKLSASSAVMLCLEEWYFQLLVLMTGLLPNPQLSLDAVSICNTVSGWVFMIPIGFNAAASVRVSNELGAGHPRVAEFSAAVVNLVCFLISLVAAVLVLGLRHVISYAFTEGELVAHAVSDLTPVLALTIVLNGIQPVLSGVAVGCGWQTTVAYIDIGCYYLVGIPLGVLFGFYFNLGTKGLWSGMLGGTVMQTIILIWFTFRTDWKKEVEKALVRVKNYDGKREPFVEG